MKGSKVRNVKFVYALYTLFLPSLPTSVGYNAYVKAIGHAIGAGAYVPPHYENKVYTIADDMPLLHFLSGEPSVHMCTSVHHHHHITRYTGGGGGEGQRLAVHCDG